MKIDGPVEDQFVQSFCKRIFRKGMLLCTFRFLLVDEVKQYVLYTSVISCISINVKGLFVAVLIKCVCF